MWLPHFAVWVERARRPGLLCGPLALVAAGERGGAALIQSASPEALAAGLAPGAPAHTIPQRCPGAVVLPFDLPYYTQRHEDLVTAFDVISPLIEAQPLEVFYLDLSGLPHLDGNNPQEVAAAVRAVVPPPFSPRVGIASGKFTARVAAHRATSLRPLLVTDAEKTRFLHDAPVTLLPASEEILRQLDLMGLRTLGALARLPRSAVLARFGWPGERLHRLACGDDREPLVPYRAVPLIRESWSFGDPPTTAVFLLALECLLRRAWARAERGDRGVRQVRLLTLTESGEVWDRRLTLRQPTERAEHAFAELKRRLETVLPSGAFTELTVELTAFAPRLDVQRLLFPDERQERQEALRREVEHLRTRQQFRGRAALYRIVEVDPWSLLPEENFGLVHYDR